MAVGMNIDIASIDMVSEVNMVSIYGLGLGAFCWGRGAVASLTSIEAEWRSLPAEEPARPPSPGRSWGASGGLPRPIPSRPVPFFTWKGPGRREPRPSSTGRAAAGCSSSPALLASCREQRRPLPAARPHCTPPPPGRRAEGPLLSSPQGSPRCSGQPLLESAEKKGEPLIATLLYAFLSCPFASQLSFKR